MKKTRSIVLATLLLVLPLMGMAFSPPPQPPITSSLSVNQLIEIILATFWSIVVAFVIIAFILSIFLAATSGGDPSKVGQARQAAIWGIVGVAVIILSYAMVNIVKNAL